MQIRGTCHCGNITFSLEWAPDPPEIPARACSCSFCSKHGGVWTSNPDARLDVRLLEPSLVSKYSFGTKTADFYVCSRCGVTPVVTSRIDGTLYAVVNVNAFDNVARPSIRALPASFDDEETDARLTRRKRRWIARVTIAEGGP